MKYTGLKIVSLEERSSKRDYSSYRNVFKNSLKCHALPKGENKLVPYDSNYHSTKLFVSISERYFCSHCSKELELDFRLKDEQLLEAFKDSLQICLSYNFSSEDIPIVSRLTEVTEGGRKFTRCIDPTPEQAFNEYCKQFDMVEISNTNDTVIDGVLYG